MSRPKRAATQKVAPKPESDIDEDENELDLSEASGDFSSADSLDDWNPSKGKKGEDETFEESESDVEESASDEDEDASESAADSPVKKTKSRGSFVATLQKKPANAFKRNLHNSLNGLNLQEILQRAQFKKKPSLLDASNEKEKTPEFDCSGGLRLSDPGSDSDDEPSTSKKAIVENGMKKSSELIDSINQASGSRMVDLRQVHDNLQEMENAKLKLINYSSKNKSSSEVQKENVNIADLLAMGETAPEPSTSQKKPSQKRARKTQAEDSDSDDGWEEVEEEESANYKIPKHGVEIMLNDFNQQQGKKKDAKPVNLEAQMKRKLNRRKKEYQVHLHKVNMVLWTVHGNYVNRKLNDTNLMASALSLLPKNNNHCYPKDKTDIDYFQQITKWFKSEIKLRNTDMYCNLRQRPPIMMSLALQMKFKAAICRRDYVMIFIILLRAIGVQCRMVQSLVCAPIMPPKSELLSLAAKKVDDANSSAEKASSRSCWRVNKQKASSSSKSSPSKPKSSSKSSRSSHSKSEGKKKSPEKSSRSSRSKSSKSSQPTTIPQLDGGDDQASSRKSKKPLKIKSLPGYKDEQSFVDIQEEQSKQSKRKSSLKIVKTSPARTRSTSRTRSPAVTKMTPRVSFSLDSPNRNSASPSEKLFKSKAKKNIVMKLQEKEPMLSPLKTRKMRKTDTKAELKVSSSKNGVNDEASTSKKVLNRKVDKNLLKSAEEKSPIKKAEDKKPRKSESSVALNTIDTLKVFSPRRLRNRSRSNEDPSPEIDSKKPNLKNLQKDRKRPISPKEEIVSKKAKVLPKVTAAKRPTKDDGEVQKKKAKVDVKDENLETDVDTDENAKYFKVLPKKSNVLATKATGPIDRRVLSSDSDDKAGPSTVPLSPSKKSKKIDIWVEVYSEKDQRWISIDVFRGKVDCLEEILKTATHPMVYVFAWNNDNSLKDVSARYCPNLNTSIRKMRVDNKYLNSVIVQYAGTKTSRDITEDDELNILQLQKPMPTTVSEFKNHPLYALKRHLLKYEAIYPPEPPILGYLREEAIYPRDCVFVLHTRETWLKEARVVKLNEKPYKMSKTLKWDNTTKKLLKDVPQELFGIWQTKDFEPPVAENGMVPRNAYGNVELFKPSMLPIGCVHLQLPGLNKVCKKLGVDCSQAIVGFDSNGGWPYPVYDGFIVCEEFQEKVIDAWNREQEEIEKKEQEKYEKRVYGNWKKLIKGLYIRQRLKNKYNFEGNQ